MTPPEFTVLVHVRATALLADVRAGRHTFFVDEPVEVGGQDTGPTPYDMLLSALGTCTAITLRVYANQKKWPLETIEIRLRHQRVHEQDCEHSEEPGYMLDEVHKEVRLLGPLTATQRQRLQLVSEKCPVQKTLTSGTLRIITTVLDDEKSESTAMQSDLPASGASTIR
ncbi:OsmC family protein [Hymenobacter sp. DG25A]|uniref:OsmC family protein n=1 Tax=Hymenobacter sp. DG25A TaxID=1385663 RepID=UPI0006BD439E|nr:OsmC family protein [Hymenobacter sp. DG25A]ALD20223.1 osmotically inducible protein C [Hymenobacter sp. DG25A]